MSLESVPSSQLSAQDAVFLYFEKEEMPLHIGSVSTFDGEISFKQFVDSVDAKLDLLPRYRQKVVFPPLSLGLPTWQYDQDFDIQRHIFEMQLEPPGTYAQLEALAGRLMSGMMDRNKPLWDLYVIQGLEGRRSALLARVHHCLADGIAGTGLMQVVLQTTADEPLPRKKKRFRPPSPPSAAEQVTEAVESTLFGSLERLLAVEKSVLGLGQAYLTESGAQGVLDLLEALPDVAAPVERLPFNRPCTRNRKVAWTEFPLDEVKAIRKALGGTVNDVGITVLTGAVRRYVKAHRETVAGRSMRMMVPVSVRTNDQRGALGNQISFVPLTVRLDADGAVDCLHMVMRRTAALKNARMAEVIRLIGTSLGFLPPPVQAMLGALPYLPTPTPIFNLVCTNVPGPQIPLYAAGQRMLQYYPYVPIALDVALGVALHSYNQQIYVGFTADAAAAPDVVRLRDFMNASYEELRRAAGVRRPRAQAKRKPAPVVEEKPAAEAPAEAPQVKAAEAGS